MAKSGKASKGCVSLVPHEKNEFWCKTTKANIFALCALAGLLCFILILGHIYGDVRGGLVAIGLIIVQAGLPLAFILIRRRGRTYDFHFKKLPPPMENARIEIHGDPAHLVPFIDIEDEVEFGEPQIAEVGDVGGRGILRIIRTASLGIALYCLAWVGVVSLAGGMGPPQTQPHMLLVKPALVLIVVTTLLMRIRTRYYRVVPQRLDVLNGGVFARMPRLVARYDLRWTRMQIKLAERIILLKTPSGQEQKIRISGINDLNAFIRGLVHAALSEREPPPMPNDALLG